MGSKVMTGVTASIRFPGRLNQDLRKLGVNLVPFPRLHFFTIAQAPLFSPRNASYVKLYVQELTTQVWSGKNYFSNVNPSEGKYLTAAATFVSNTTALKDMFKRLSTQFSSLYKRKAFLHWYKGEGMDEMEFQEADKNVIDLITEYQDKQV